MERERLVSIVGGRAVKYVGLKKPSQIIPFKGKFPLLEPYQIALLEEGFKKYLSEYNITVDDFMKLSNSDKSDKLMNWLNRDCIDFSQLTIK